MLVVTVFNSEVLLVRVLLMMMLLVMVLPVMVFTTGK